MPNIVIPEPAMTVTVETGRWRREGNIAIENWEAILFVMGNPVLRRTYLDRDYASDYPAIAAEYDATASTLEDAQDKFGVEVADLFKCVLLNAHGHGPAA